MNTRQSALTATIAAALLLPGLSFANMVWHPAGNEAGYTFHPDHVMTITRSRAEVQREAIQAAQDGQWRCLTGERSGCTAERPAGPGKTRDEVKRELLSTSATEKLRLQALGGGQ
ncbi:MAG: DUF4148 domain-containing protein [Burkholderiaceae bacterium]|nr:DUF4148 domain-containing protein [Burkholderiaceae bacterium]